MDGVGAAGACATYEDCASLIPLLPGISPLHITTTALNAPENARSNLSSSEVTGWIERRGEAV